jgi:hypothetical protein
MGYGSTSFQRAEPHLGGKVRQGRLERAAVTRPERAACRRVRRRGVALKVAFERQTLKPVFSLDRC